MRSVCGHILDSLASFSWTRRSRSPGRRSTTPRNVDPRPHGVRGQSQLLRHFPSVGHPHRRCARRRPTGGREIRGFTGDNLGARPKRRVVTSRRVKPPAWEPGSGAPGWSLSELAAGPARQPTWGGNVTATANPRDGGTAWRFLALSAVCYSGLSLDGFSLDGNNAIWTGSAGHPTGPILPGFARGLGRG